MVWTPVNTELKYKSLLEQMLKKWNKACVFIVKSKVFF